MKAYIILHENTTQVFNEYDAKDNVQWQDYKIMEHFKCSIFWNEASAQEEIVIIRRLDGSNPYIRTIDFIA